MILPITFHCVKMNFPIYDFFSKCNQILGKQDLLTFTKEIPNTDNQFSEWKLWIYFYVTIPWFFLTYCTTGIAENELAQYPIPHKLLFHFQYKKQDEGFFRVSWGYWDIEGFFSKCEQIRSFLRIWSHLLKKSLMENLISCAVFTVTGSHKQIPFDSISKYKSNRAMTFRTMTNI